MSAHLLPWMEWSSFTWRCSWRVRPPLRMPGRRWLFQRRRHALGSRWGRAPGMTSRILLHMGCPEGVCACHVAILAHKGHKARVLLAVHLRFSRRPSHSAAGSSSRAPLPFSLPLTHYLCDPTQSQ